MTRFASLVLGLVVALGITLPASASSATPVAEEAPAEVVTFFDTLAERVSTHDETLWDLYTEDGLTAVFGTTDPDNLSAAMSYMVEMTIVLVQDARVKDDTTTVVVSYTGFYNLHDYTTKKYTLVRADGQLRIKAEKAAKFVYPEGKTVSKGGITVTNDTYQASKPTLKKADFVTFTVKNDGDEFAGLAIYTLPDGQDYTATVTAGGMLDPNRLVTAISVSSKDKKSASIVGLEPGEYIVVDLRLGESWPSGRSTHFTIK